MKFDNYMILDFPSKSANEAFARSAVACFAAQMDPTLNELEDIQTAVSETVLHDIDEIVPQIGHQTTRAATDIRHLVTAEMPLEPLPAHVTHMAGQLTRQQVDVDHRATSSPLRKSTNFRRATPSASQPSKSLLMTS